MIRTSRTFSWAVAALALVPWPVAGQITIPTDNTAYGTTAAEFLLLGASARGLALSDAYAALATDVSALYYNPAGIAQLDRPGALFTTYSYGGGARAFGLQVGNFGFSDQPVYTVEQPDGTGGTYGVSETFLGATLAQSFSDRFSAGITGKFISDKLGQVTGRAFAVDFGTSFHATTAGRPIRASFVIQNLGSTLSHTGIPLDVTVTRPPVPGQVDVPQEGQPATLNSKGWGLPVLFRVGVALDAVSSGQNRVTLLSEFNQPNNNRAGFAFGAELSISDIAKTGFYFQGRGSWQYAAANDLDPGTAAGFSTGLSGKANKQGLAAGFGVGYKRNRFGLGTDYAYRSMGLLGGTNVLTFTVNW